jgi:hypothetical protein
MYRVAVADRDVSVHVEQAKDGEDARRDRDLEAEITLAHVG